MIIIILKMMIDDNDFDNDYMMITLFEVKKRLERYEELAQEMNSLTGYGDDDNDIRHDDYNYFDDDKHDDFDDDGDLDHIY